MLSCSQKSLSRAQINKNYTDKLKRNNKYDEHKAKIAASMRKHRNEMKAKENQLTDVERASVIENRREAVRQRVQKCRERKKQSTSNDSNHSTKASYSNKQTLCKATKKVARAMPDSPTKKRAVLIELINDYNDEDRDQLLNVLKSPLKKRQFVLNDELITAIQQFYHRDDI